MNVATVGEFWGVLRRKYDEMGVLKGSSLLFSRDRRGEGLRRGGDDDNGGVEDWARYQRYDPKKCPDSLGFLSLRNAPRMRLSYVCSPRRTTAH